MKLFLEKIEDYLALVSLEEISDRRFVAILDLYKNLKKETEVSASDEIQDEEFKSFLEALDDLNIEK